MQNGWICPKCKKEHSKPHYAFRDQVDYSKKPEEPGRVKFNRAQPYGDGLKGDTEFRDNLPPTGDDKTRKGDDNGLFCSHCGFVQEIIVLINTKRKK